MWSIRISKVGAKHNATQRITTRTSMLFRSHHTMGITLCSKSPIMCDNPAKLNVERNFRASIMPLTQIFQHMDNKRTFSSRRRRRAVSNPTVTDDESRREEERLSKVIPDDDGIVTDKELFLQASSAFLQQTIKALEPMKAHNEVFHLILSSNEQGQRLTVGLRPSEGQYVLQVDDELCTLTLTSPMSGNYTYILCAFTGNFIGMHDGHLCQGMLVRDMIRHCYGVPQF